MHHGKQIRGYVLLRIGWLLLCRGSAWLADRAFRWSAYNCAVRCAIDYTETGRRLEELLQLPWHAVSISFLNQPPAGVLRVSAPAPAGCAYWRRASGGETFYTAADDHLGCPIGAFTHGVSLSPDKAAELEGMVGYMTGLNYLRAEEAPAIPHRSEPFRAAVYGPLTQSRHEPDVVIIRGNARRLMLLTEAALAAGIGLDGLVARPTCAFIPAVLQSGRAIASFGCIGNRVYTGLGDGELYFAAPGSRIGGLVAQLEKILGANQVLESFHQARCS